MSALSPDLKSALRRPDAIDRLLSEGISLHRIEEMLDQLEYEEACAATAPAASRSLLGLLWS
jgi:hypothetical protein